MSENWIETEDFETFSKNYEDFINQVVSDVNEKESYLVSYLRDEFGDSN